jgi:dihydroorotate dehydrogenase (NAD+) catalytic subunit
MGGIMEPADAVEFLLAGATAVAVGTANFVDPRSAERIADGLERFCAERGIARVADLIGALRA